MTLGAVTHQTATRDPTARAVGETPQAGPPPPCLEEMGWIGGAVGVRRPSSWAQITGATRSLYSALLAKKRWAHPSFRGKSFQI